MVKLTGIFFGVSVILVAAGWHAGIATAKTTAGTVIRPAAMNCFFAGVLLLTLLAGTSQWKAMVNRPVLQWFGAISYGLYLIHMMAFDVTDYGLNRLFPFAPYSDRDTSFIALRFAMGAGLAIAVSYLSRWYFEEPFLRLKSRWES
jgi:peptidoglycan/LPS O-acetylase OafA/YrhL